MGNESRFYIDGRWVEPVHPGDEIVVVDPATEEEVARVAAASAADVESAVQAAHRAFPAYAQTTREERLELLTALREAYKKRIPQLAEAMTTEVGIPRGLAERGQVLAGARHLKEAIDALRDYAFDEDWGTTRVRREPVGVCALLAPWNWPMNQVACKVGPALAAGCTMVLKPSQLSPLSALVFAEAVDEAGYPAGVFNMVNGAGAALGDTFATHPLVDMISLTGSTAVGGVVGAAAAPSIKRVSLELGGKSANLVFEDVDVARAVSRGVHECMHNSGQSCNAPDADARRAGDLRRGASRSRRAPRTSSSSATRATPRPSWARSPGASSTRRCAATSESGIDEGARLVAGGLERPDGLDKGFFVRPTVFADVTPEMRIFREEIFGPVLTMTPFRDEDHAVELANASDYGLSGYVQSADLERARRVAGRMRTGMVHLNGAPTDASAPFGGYKQSGNGREWGRFGLEEYLEVKSVMGYTPRQP